MPEIRTWVTMEEKTFFESLKDEKKTELRKIFKNAIRLVMNDMRWNK